MSADEQIAALVDLGYSLPTATSITRRAVALVPEGADLTTWLPPAELLDDGVGDIDEITARNEWYATAPDEYVRILDAQIEE